MNINQRNAYNNNNPNLEINNVICFAFLWCIFCGRVLKNNSDFVLILLLVLYILTTFIFLCRISVINLEYKPKKCVQQQQSKPWNKQCDMFRFFMMFFLWKCCNLCLQPRWNKCAQFSKNMVYTYWETCWWFYFC